MFHVFARSWKGLNLSPGERASMKLVEGVLVTAVGSGTLIAIQLLATGNHDFRYIGIAAGGAAAKTLWDTVKKYTAAQTDVPLAAPSLVSPPAAVLAQETQKIATPAPVAAPKFTTPVPQEPVQQFMQPVAPMGTYVTPPFITIPPGASTTNVPSSFDRGWSDMVPSMPTERIPTP